jgi:cytoskeletal protein CcmA (bactofilin family)
MAIRSSEYLKGKFEDGDRPTGTDFVDLIDSTLNSNVSSLSAAGTAKLTVISTGVSAIGDLYTTGNLNVAGTLKSTGNLTSKNISNTDTTTTITNNVIVEGSHHITGTLSAGNLIIPSDLSIGTSSSDTVTINARVSGDVIPKTDISSDFGSYTNRFKSGFFNGSIQGGIFTCGPLLETDTSLTAGTRSFCIEELDINANVTLNIFNNAELKVTPYNNF